MGQSRLAGAEAKTPAQSEQRENSLAGPHVSGMGDDLMLYGQPRCFDWKVKSPHTHKPLGTLWHLGAVEPLDRGASGRAFEGKSLTLGSRTFSLLPDPHDVNSCCLVVPLS